VVEDLPRGLGPRNHARSSSRGHQPEVRQVPYRFEAELERESIRRGVLEAAGPDGLDASRQAIVDQRDTRVCREPAPAMSRERLDPDLDDRSPPMPSTSANPRR